MRRIVMTLAGAAVLAACGGARADQHVPAGQQAEPVPSGTTVSTGTTSLGTVLTDLQGLHPLLLPAGEELDDRGLHRRLPHRRGHRWW